VTRRLEHLVGASLATIAMLVASVSACACDHYGKKPIQAVPSCHAAAHDRAATADTPSDNDRIDTGCDCSVPHPLPLVASKFESKKIKLQKEAATSQPPEIAMTASTAISNNRLPRSVFRPDNYSFSYRYRAPSRAPPRL
jgi:hypothetical protein